MKEKRGKNIAIAVLCIALVFMAVGYAALSQTLTINGTATVEGSWDVHFISIEDITGSNATNEGVSDTVPTVPDTGATTLDVSFSLKKPGDYVVYKVVVENKGNIDAVLSELQGVSSAFNEQSANWVQRQVFFGASDSPLTGGDSSSDYKYNVSGVVPTLEADGSSSDTIEFVVRYTLNPDIVLNPTDGQIGMPEFNETDKYVVTDTLQFTYVQKNV